MSVFDIFKQAPAASAAPTTPAVAANPTVPSTATVPATVDPATVSPLDKFQDLWKTDPNAKPDEPFSFNSDPSKLMETARTVDFTKVISPEVMARINGGGAEAQSAVVEAMNSVAQLTFAQAANGSTKIAEQAVAAAEARFKAMLPMLIKQHTVTDTLRTQNPLLTNPAAAPMVDALQHQFTKQFPQATAAEINSQVNDYLNSMADVITSTRPKPKEASKGRKEEDWSKFVPE